MLYIYVGVLGLMLTHTPASLTHSLSRNTFSRAVSRLLVRSRQFSFIELMSYVSVARLDRFALSLSAFSVEEREDIAVDIIFNDNRLMCFRVARGISKKLN